MNTQEILNQVNAAANMCVHGQIGVIGWMREISKETGIKNKAEIGVEMFNRYQAAKATNTKLTFSLFMNQQVEKSIAANNARVNSK